MKSNKMLYAGIAVLILGIGFAVGTYAYYQNVTTGTATGTVLAWNCNAYNKDTPTDFTFNLGALYPGSQGSGTIRVESSINASYEITFSNFQNIGAEAASHTNLLLYRDASYTQPLGTGSTISGTVAANSTSDKTFYYKWAYGNSAETYSTAAPSVTLTVVCTQVDPNA